MKFYNFNLIYDEYVKSFLLKNKGKYTETQLEDIQPKLFEKFKSQKIKNIGDITVLDYYEQNKNNLISYLKEYLKRGLEPDEFLIDSICKNVSVDILNSYLNPCFDADFLNVILKILDNLGHVDFDLLISMLSNEKTPYETVNAIIDILKQSSDTVYNRLLGVNISDKRVVCEIISECKIRDKNITKFLCDELIKHKDKMVEYLDYLVKYGDESCLVFLYELIESEEIGYLEYKELKIGIEALGGEYQKVRDFSFDKNYKLLKGEDD